jgi:hypothetical protein
MLAKLPTRPAFRFEIDSRLNHGVELLPKPVRAPSQRLTFSRAKLRRRVQNLREWWENCNLQFSIAALFSEPWKNSNACVLHKA